MLDRADLHRMRRRASHRGVVGVVDYPWTVEVLFDVTDAYVHVLTPLSPPASRGRRMCLFSVLLDDGPFVVVFRTHAENLDLPFCLAELFGQFLLQCPSSGCVDVTLECAVLDAFQSVVEADVGDFFADAVFYDVVDDVGVHKL